MVLSSSMLKGAQQYFLGLATSGRMFKNHLLKVQPWVILTFKLIFLKFTFHFEVIKYMNVEIRKINCWLNFKLLWGLYFRYLFLLVAIVAFDICNLAF